MSRSLSFKPAGWLTTIALFGIPALIFFLLFHWVGPRLREQGASWWIIFQCLLVAPLGCMLLAPFVLLGIEYGSSEWKTWIVRLRLTSPALAAWLWAAALSAFMYGGNWEDLVVSIVKSLSKHSNQQFAMRTDSHGQAGLRRAKKSDS